MSRDPPEGGTDGGIMVVHGGIKTSRFQFLGIPPKGEHTQDFPGCSFIPVSFQFLGIPPKGELVLDHDILVRFFQRFQFLGIPPKGELRQVEKPPLWRGWFWVSNF